MTEISTIKERVQHGSTTHLIDIVFPGGTNHHGTLFGGAGLALMDRVAFIAATRFGRVPFVTASCERNNFRQSARIGHIIEFTARPIKAGRRSLAIEVEMVAETIVGRQRHPRTRGIFNMVAVPEAEQAAHYALPKLLPGESPQSDDAVSMVEIVEVEARAERVGRSSVSIETKLWSENLLTGARHITATGHFTMVAVGEDHRPILVRGVATRDVLLSGVRGA